MSYTIERMRFISREYVRANRDKLFLFGDNLERKGFGGQAAAMRGEPNAIGIPTKKSPNNSERAFFSDNEFGQNKAAIDAAFAEVAGAVTDAIRAIVIPGGRTRDRQCTAQHKGTRDVRLSSAKVGGIGFASRLVNPSIPHCPDSILKGIFEPE